MHPVPEPSPTAGGPAALTARGREHAAAGRHAEALAAFEAAVAADRRAIGAHVGIYEVAQILGRPELALAHQAEAIALASIHSTLAGGREAYALLVPSVPGPWTANTPVDLLFDPAQVTIHRWYVDPARPVPALPRYDAVFVAAGESQAAQPALTFLEQALADQPAPVLNDPARIAQLGRIPFARGFAGARHCRVVTTERLSRAAYAAAGYPTPHIVRPLDAPGGHGLERIDDDAGRAAHGYSLRFSAVVPGIWRRTTRPSSTSARSSTTAAPTASTASTASSSSTAGRTRSTWRSRRVGWCTTTMRR